MPSFLEILHCHDASQERGIRFGSAESELISYAQLWEQAASQGEALAGRFPSGDRILLVGDNSQNQVVALLACWWAGLVPLCVAPPARLSPGQIYL